MQESTLVTQQKERGAPLAVEMRDIYKAWPGVVASDHVNLAVRKGEIHALVGENGAGKSTLMNILYGLVHPDSGEVLINGQVTQINGPRDAIRLGIGMVHQHFMLIPPLTVAENIVLGTNLEVSLPPMMLARPAQRSSRWRNSMVSLLILTSASRSSQSDSNSASRFSRRSTGAQTSWSWTSQRAF